MTTYAESKLDRALAGATPVFTASHTGKLPTLANRQHGYLLGGNGLFVVGRGTGFTAVVPVGGVARPTPFAEVEPGLYFDQRLVPRNLIEAAAERAIQSGRLEYAGGITCRDGLYELVEPTVESASPSHITYDRTSIDDDALVVDLHSHGLSGPYFSDDDNASDAQSIYIAVVFGQCKSRCELKMLSRVTVNGHTMTLSLDQWMTA